MQGILADKKERKSLIEIITMYRGKNVTWQYISTRTGLSCSFLTTFWSEVLNGSY